jgi:hypothetical protein
MDLELKSGIFNQEEQGDFDLIDLIHDDFQVKSEKEIYIETKVT